MSPLALCTFHVYGYEMVKDIMSTDGEYILGSFGFDYTEAKGGCMELSVAFQCPIAQRFFRMPQ